MLLQQTRILLLYYTVQCFIQSSNPGGARVWGGADEPLPSMGSGAKPPKIFLISIFRGPKCSPGEAKPPWANA
jgi:hypothetical protein